MMKKTLTLAIFALAASTACSDLRYNEINDSNRQALTFRTVTEKSSRATETDATNIKDFRIFGLWDSSYDFMYKVDVVREAGDAWTYAPLRYWPETGIAANNKVDFYAYSPAGSRGLTTVFAKTATSPVVGYAVPAAAHLQEDFLVSIAAQQDKSNNPVQLIFKHALSQAVFQARSSLVDVVFHISDIKFTNMLSAGNLDLSNVAAGWQGIATSVTYTAPITEVPIMKYATDPDRYTTLSGPNDGMMLMPQVLTPGDGVDADADGIPDDIATAQYLVLTYTARLVSGTEIVPSTKAYIPLTGIPGGDELVMGKKYTFQITLTTGLTPIVFTVTSVEPWETPNNVPLG